MKASASSNRKGGGDRHGWNSEQGYFNAHEQCLDELRAYFIEDDTLRVVALGRDQIRMQGRITCKYGLFVDVYKLLRRNAKGQVRTVSYSYQACIAGERARELFRYDNKHPHAGHPDPHHKHTFDPRTGDEILPPEWIGVDRWPHLNEVIIELHSWWFETGKDLEL